MDKVFTGIGKFSVKFRYLIVLVWIVGAFASVKYLPSLGSVVQNNNSSFLPKSSPSLQAAKMANVFQNTNDSIVIVVVSKASGALTSADQSAIQTLATELKGTKRVVSSTVAGVSKDQQAAQIEVLSSVSPFADTTAQTGLVDNLRQVIAAHPVPSGLSAHLAGQLATTVDSQKANGNNFNSTQSYSIFFILIILLIVFRSVLAPFITLIPAVVVSVMAAPVVARLSSILNFQVSNITQLLMIVLVLGAGTDYGLFLVFRVREEIQKGKDGKDAVRYAVLRVGESITFSAFTVMAALISLVSATFGFYKGLGYPLAIAVFFMLLAGLTLQPALLAIAGKAAFWPTKPHKGAAKVGLWGRVAGRVVQRPAITLAIGIVVFGSLSLVSIGNKPSGFTSSSAVPSKSDSALGNAALAKHFNSGSFNPTQLLFKYTTSVWTQLNTLQALQTSLAGSSQFKALQGPFNPFGGSVTPAELGRLHGELGNPSKLPAVQPSSIALPNTTYEAYRSAQQFISKDGHTVLFNATLSSGDPSSTAAMSQIPAIRTVVTQAQQKYGAIESSVAGQAPASYDISTASNNDLFHIVPIVVVIIAILLGIVLRSLIAPLYLVVSVVLSYLAALGADVLYFMHIQGQPGLSFVLPFMLFLFLLALGEDYNILVMTRIREEAHALPLKDAVRKAIGATGATVTSAGLVLAATFFVLGFAGGSGNPQVQEIGYGLALGIVMDTFLVRTLLVPSTVVLLGKWNWWPSKLQDLHEELGTTEAPETPVVVG